jgi:urea transport system permease protein
LACFALGGAETAGAYELPEEARESFLSSKINDRGAGISALSSDYSDGAAAVLEALLAGNLYADRASKTFFIREGESYKPLSTMEPADTSGLSLRAVGVNNRQRQALTAILNSRSLKHPDEAVRLAASRSLVAQENLDLSLIREFGGSEESPAVRRNYDRILAVSALRSPDSPKAEVLAALDLFKGSLTPEARELISARLSSGDPEISSAAAAALSSMDAKTSHVQLLETMFFGLSLGSVLVLIGLGLAITFGVMGVINMAHGEMVMLGAYSVWLLQRALPGSPEAAVILAVPFAFLVSGSAGALIEVCVIRHLYKRPLETLLATFGVSLILQQAVRTFIASNNVPVAKPSFLSGQWHITENFSVTLNRLWIIAFCLAVFFLVCFIIQKTRMGLEVRAVTQNRDTARALGINSAWVDTRTFVLGSGAAGMAGVALSQLTNVGPNLGQQYIVDSFMVVVFGGVGNMFGTLIGGLILGMANMFLEPAFGSVLAKILMLFGIILFIQRYPSGLFPQKGRAAVL